MKDDSTKPLSKVIRIDESEKRGHLNEIVRGTVEETLLTVMRMSVNRCRIRGLRTGLSL